MMPSAAAPWRGEQLSLLAKLLHSRQSSHEFEDLILEASTELQKETKRTTIEANNAQTEPR